MCCAEVWMHNSIFIRKLLSPCLHTCSQKHLESYIPVNSGYPGSVPGDLLYGLLFCLTEVTHNDKTSLKSDMALASREAQWDSHLPRSREHPPSEWSRSLAVRLHSGPAGDLLPSERSSLYKVSACHPSISQFLKSSKNLNTSPKAREQNF